MQGEIRRNARTRHQQVWCMRGGMWELLNLAKFGTEAGQAQLVEERGSTDDLSVESNVERGPRPDVSSTSDGERWPERI